MRVTLTLPVLVALVVLAVLAPCAHAWTAPPATDEGRLAAYLPIARAAWPDSPCAGRETVYLHADDAIDGWDAAEGHATGGRGSAATCEVWMRSSPATFTAARFCGLLVHEFGHLAGYGHTDDPLDVHAPPGPWAEVMYAGKAASWPACDAATAPPPSVQARAAIRRLLPYPRASWTLICTPLRNDGRCRALRGGSTPRHFTVFVASGFASVVLDENG
jgi:hypothetical protein